MKIFNFIQFQLIWFLSVFYKNNLLYISFIVFFTYIFLLYYKSKKNFLKEIKLIFLCAVTGCFGDSLLMNFHVFELDGYQSENYFIPIWLGMIWLGFSSTINSSISYFSTISFKLQAFLGALVGPAVYFLSNKYTGIVLPEPQIQN